MRSEQSLVRWATPQLHDIDLLAKMVDPALNGMYPAKSLSRFADVIALCVQVKFLKSLNSFYALTHIKMFLSSQNKCNKFLYALSTNKCNISFFIKVSI